MPGTLLNSLNECHALIHSMANRLNDEEYRRQYHPDLSPLGWHVGHCVYIETYWLREVILGDDSLTAELAWLYIPENIIKPKRGPALPEMHEHLDWCKQIASENQRIIKKAAADFSQHPLNQRDYMLHFLIQHHSQHIETMAMVLAQRQLQLQPALSVKTPLQASTNIKYDFQQYRGGDFIIGNPSGPEAFDNELPPYPVMINPFALAQHPVSNSDWLSFINDKGYQDSQWWDEDGWQWCMANKIGSPETWHLDTESNFYEITTDGASELNPAAAVSGINYFEANAYINWLNETTKQDKPIRLPHEYEWEVAEQSGGLANTGQVWEWCQNNFHPYPGFSAFPYDNYSKPWFDNKHFSLRGGSAFTQPSIRRSSFRNFYNPDKRHIFSGLRLAMQSD